MCSGKSFVSSAAVQTLETIEKINLHVNADGKMLSLEKWIPSAHLEEFNEKTDDIFSRGMQE